MHFLSFVVVIDGVRELGLDVFRGPVLGFGDAPQEEQEREHADGPVQTERPS